MVILNTRFNLHVPYFQWKGGCHPSYPATDAYPTPGVNLGVLVLPHKSGSAWGWLTKLVKQGLSYGNSASSAHIGSFIYKWWREVR